VDGIGIGVGRILSPSETICSLVEAEVDCRCGKGIGGPNGVDEVSGIGGVEVRCIGCARGFGGANGVGGGK
jgi:hypothetical protein